MLAALFTLYLNSLGFLQQGLFDLVITIEGVILAELILYRLFETSGETELTIKLHSKGEKVGFSVESENKTIKNAYPIFGGTRYQWEGDDGSLHSSKDLYVGAEPCYFYPLIARFENEEVAGRVESAITLVEVKNNRIINYLDEEGKDFVPEYKSISIRIVGDGNETKKDYKLIHFYPCTDEAVDTVIGAAEAFRLVEQKRNLFRRSSPSRRVRAS